MTKSASNYTPPPLASPEIVFEDACLLVVNKPTGLLTVPGRGPEKADCLVARTFPEIRVVHRLDMETSGLVVFARDPHTQRVLGRMFETRRIQKTYIAIVGGKPEPEMGEISAPLIVDWPNRPRQKIDFELGKPSCTRYRLVAFDAQSNRSRLELNPVTGRSHQLRVHLLSIGHPIIGDTLYGTPSPAAESQRLLLHAESLQFEHPQSGRLLQLTIPAPF